MTRRVYIERTLRQIYGGFPSDDSQITINLVNVWLNDAIALAAKTNYKDNISIDGIGYVNNGFYTTFKGLAITKNEQFLWRVTLPQIPLGIGSNDGISTVELKDDTGRISYPLVLISENQRSFAKGMKTIPNKLVGYQQGTYVYILSTLLLSDYTATATMISGGVSTDLDSELNVPSDYFPVMTEYIKQQLMFQRGVQKDTANDGLDQA